MCSNTRNYLNNCFKGLKSPRLKTVIVILLFSYSHPVIMMLQKLQIAFAILPPLIFASSLPDQVVLVPIIRIRNSSAHGAVIGVGTPPQQNTILLDTGSFSFTFENPNSALCKQADTPCAAYGSYDNATSSTAVYAGFPANDGVQDFGTGSSINDTVTLSSGAQDPSLAIANMTIGHLDVFYSHHALTAPQTGFLGMRAQCVNRVCHGPGIDFLEQLYSRALVAKRAFSIYLGPDDPDATGAMIISGVDRAKQASEFVTIPMVDVGNISLSENATNYVYQSSYSVTLAGNGTSVGTNTTAFPLGDADKKMLVDTGTSRWDMPQAVFANGVAPFFGIAISGDGGGNPSQLAPFTVDCAYRNASPLNTINVYFNDDKDVIRVPFAGLVTEWAPGQCIVNVDGGQGVFGAPFLRNVLSVYDNEKLTVSFSQVRYTDEEDIVAL